MAMAAATTKFFHTTSSILRHRALTLPSPPLRTQFLSTPARGLLLRPISQTPALSAAAAEEVAASPAVADPQIWPEWEAFLEKLKGKGYFDKASPGKVDEESAEGERGSDDVGGSLASPSYYSRVKIACLGFARERPDLLRSLPKGDIQAVVERGCPNLLRKSVNSAKRLRAYLRLDEGDVCSACILRGSCDRAYILAKKDEGARTVDIVRILLQYAAEPVANPQIKERTEESARKLLLELIRLSDTSPDVDFLKEMEKQPATEKQPRLAKVRETKEVQNAEMKRGDWICSECKYMNYARNLRCLQCKADGPNRVNPVNVEMKKGDWSCPKCRFMNFARNTTCRRCQGSRPREQLDPGEWECPSCNFLNFRRNKVCLKCNCDRPRDESNPYEDDIWRRPKLDKDASENWG